MTPAQHTTDDATHRLIHTAEAVVARRETPSWKDTTATAHYIHQLRAAVADVKNQQEHQKGI